MVLMWSSCKCFCFLPEACQLFPISAKRQQKGAVTSSLRLSFLLCSPTPISFKYKQHEVKEETVLSVLSDLLEYTCC